MIVIITGMHRSGTSLLAGILHNNGIDMGNSFDPKPSKWNPTGHFENRAFRRLNDKMLERNKCKVKLWKMPVMVDESTDEETAQMIDLIVKYCTLHEIWGFKDPRTSLTLKAWIKVLRSMQQPFKVLATVRHPDAIARSLMLREKRGLSFRVSKMIEAAYRRILNEALLEIPFNQHMRVSYEGMLFDPRGYADSLSAFLGHDIKDMSLIQPKLNRCGNDS